jgi:hypothetical protein
MATDWSKRFELIRSFGWLSLGGLFLGLIAALTSGPVRKWTAIFGVLLCLPALLYTYVIILWHWKDRYRGKHSDLWGAVILLETSGWLKIVYFFRHLVPDMQRTGRYAVNNTPAVEMHSEPNTTGVTSN